MPTIDLHSHSTYSDGSLSPRELVTLAHSVGVTTLALTDHDSTAGIPEAQLAAQECGLRLITGVEISVLWQHKHLLHIVALNVDINHPVLQAGLAEQAQARGRRAQQIAAKLQALGLGDCWPQVLTQVDGDVNRIGRTHFARYLMESGAVRSLQQAFDRYLGTGKPAGLLMPWVDLATALSWIHAAGGVAVLAHPMRYGLSQTKLRAALEEFKQEGGQAIEVSSANEKPHIVSQVAQLAQRFDLYASQGSDYHGRHMPWLKLGCFVPLPAHCKPVWELLT